MSIPATVLPIPASWWGSGRSRGKIITHRHALSPFPPGTTTPQTLGQYARSRPHSETASLNPERRQPLPSHTGFILVPQCPIFIPLGGPKAHPTLGMTNRRGRWFDKWWLLYRRLFSSFLDRLLVRTHFGRDENFVTRHRHSNRHLSNHRP